MRWAILLPFVAAIPAPALASPTAASVPADKMICKRQLETGTLAKWTKTCLTKAEWDKLRRKSQELGQNLQDRNFSSCSMSPAAATRAAEAGPTC